MQPWQAEQAKLLWAQGQPGMALRLRIKALSFFSVSRPGKVGCLARRPDAAQPWQAEQAKLLWAQGQAGMALRLARALLADSPRWAGLPEASAERASLLSRTGKWIAQSRCALLRL